MFAEPHIPDGNLPIDRIATGLKCDLSTDMRSDQFCKAIPMMRSLYYNWIKDPIALKSEETALFTPTLPWCEDLALHNIRSHGNKVYFIAVALTGPRDKAVNLCSYDMTSATMVASTEIHGYMNISRFAVDDTEIALEHSNTFTGISFVIHSPPNSPTHIWLKCRYGLHKFDLDCKHVDDTFCLIPQLFDDNYQHFAMRDNFAVFTSATSVLLANISDVDNNPSVVEIRQHGLTYLDAPWIAPNQPAVALQKGDDGMNAVWLASGCKDYGHMCVTLSMVPALCTSEDDDVVPLCKGWNASMITVNPVTDHIINVPKLPVFDITRLIGCRECDDAPEVHTFCSPNGIDCITVQVFRRRPNKTFDITRPYMVLCTKGTDAQPLCAESYAFPIEEYRQGTAHIFFDPSTTAPQFVWASRKSLHSLYLA